MARQCRFALMFDTPGHDLKALEKDLRRNGEAIRTAVGANPVRLGVADRHPDLIASARGVDGVIEVTIEGARISEVSEISRALRPLLAEIAELASVEIMVGPMFPMVPVRKGNTFLSLAFRRFPGTTSQQFRDWWFNQHSQVAIPVLGAGLLAYDQVHVDEAASESAASAYGAPVVKYDAYDNLTWADRNAFLHSCSDAEGMAMIARDEVGRIDHASGRSALMYEVR